MNGKRTCLNKFNIGKITIGGDSPLVVIAGPCQIESQTHAEQTAGAIYEISKRLGIPVVYKSSFDKANRSSVSTQRGVGIDQGLKILNGVKHLFGMPVLTDIHESYQAEVCADAGIDVLQIPAFLCRQTDLLLAAGASVCCATGYEKCCRQNCIYRQQSHHVVRKRLHAWIQ